MVSSPSKISSNIAITYIVILLAISLFQSFMNNSSKTLEDITSSQRCRVFSSSLDLEKRTEFSNSQINTDWKIQTSEGYQEVNIQKSYLNSLKKDATCLGAIRNFDISNGITTIEVGTNPVLFQLIKLLFLATNILIFVALGVTSRSFLIIISSIMVSYNLNLLLNFEFLFNTDYKYYLPYIELLDSVLICLPIIAFYKNKSTFFVKFNTSKINFKTTFFFTFFIFYLSRILFITLSGFQFNDVIEEWFTNYNFGFTRRGLVGTILFNSNLFNQDNLVVYFSIFTLLIYALYLISLKKIILDNSVSISDMLIILSPIFIIYNLFWGSSIILPKELLGILVYLFFLNYSNKINQNFLYAAIFLLAYNFSIYSHEINLWITPFIILSFYLKNKQKNDFYVLFLVLLSAVTFITALYLFGEGSKATSDLLCSSTYKVLLPESTCYKSFILNNSDIFSNIANTRDVIFLSTNYGYYIKLYLTYFTLAMLPLLMYPWARKNLFPMSLVFITFVPLFFTAVDWGRWLSLFFHLLFITFFKFNTDKENLLKNLFSNNIYLFMYLLLIYIFGWSVPQCCVTEYSYMYLFQFTKQNITLFFSILIFVYTVFKKNSVGQS